MLFAVLLALAVNAVNDTCFNCMLTDYKCKQFGFCSPANGQCICPTGWGSQDCRWPLCQSPNDPNRHPSEEICQCADGWSGPNCQVCQNDTSCAVDGQVCYKGGMPVHHGYQNCKVVNTALSGLLGEQKATTSFTCDMDPIEPAGISPNTCRFEFWLDGRQSFYCQLDECEFDYSTMPTYNVTGGLCKKVKCECLPNEILCGKEYYGVVIDLQDGVFDTLVKGPGSLICKKPGGFQNKAGPYDCEFDEPGLREALGPALGTNPVIELVCDAGECLSPGEVPGYKPPQKYTNWTLIWSLVAVCILFFLVGGYLIYALIRKIERERQYQSVGGFASAEEEEHLRQIEREIMQGNRIPASLVFKDIRYEIMERKSDGTQQKKRVLRGISGCVQPGEMLAIMGASGAGKSTCLDILAGKTKKGHVSGQLFINKATPTRSEFKQITGYVDQEDNLLPTLTVYETLLCCALLRLPKVMTYEMKVRRVKDVLAELGIEHIANMRVGGGLSAGSIFGSGSSPEGGSGRGISGGEKRRVSIAMEFIPSPSIIYADEITSGLDSYNAYSVIYNLKKLAVNYGRSVVISLHQPRADIFGMFDRLLLLGEGGYMVYSGRLKQPSNSSQMVAEADMYTKDSMLNMWLASVGQKCPDGFNIADYIIDLTKLGKSIEQSQQKLSEAPVVPGPSLIADFSSCHIQPDVQDMSDLQLSKPYLWKLVYGYYVSPICQELKDEMNAILQTDPEDKSRPWQQNSMDDNTTSSSIPLVGSNSTSYGRIDSPILNEDDEPLLSPQRRKPNQTIKDHLESLLMLTRPAKPSSQPGFWQQFKILSWRTTINFYRNPFLMYGHYGVAILLAVMSGLLFWQVTNDLSGFQNRLGVFFFILAVFGFASLSSLEVFSQERSLFMRERSAGFYGVGVYFLTKVLFDILPLRVIPPLLLGIVSYFMIGLAPGLLHVLKFLLVLVLFNLTAAGICLVIAVLCGNHLALANLIAVMWMLFSMLFGGFLLNKDNIPAVFSWLPYMSFYNFAFEALIVNELAELQLSDKQMGIPIQVPGTVILKTFGFGINNYWPDVSSLLWMFLVFIVAAFVFLQVFVKEKK